ncbi:FAD-dependent oxidoreductase [Nocardioides sp.]|uniref:FAD-dependent oxidoreductase n=1 Tax=Nocardioides sp. TaxID=35761 RepID=UPI00351374E8
MNRSCDVAVVGGGPAGLAATLQLARQRRSVIVIDDDTPRNAPAAHMHGYLGHESASPQELRARGRVEVRSYGGEVLSGRVTGATRDDAGRIALSLTGGHTLRARRVLLATGLRDELPDIEGVAAAWGGGVLHCPFCHGFEVRDTRLVQIVTHSFGLHPTALLRHLTTDLTVVLHGGVEIDAAALAPYESAGVPVLRADVRRVLTRPADSGPADVEGVELADGTVVPADAVMVGPRFAMRAEVAAGLGLTPVAHVSGAGDLVEVDERGETAVRGLYAAGNVTDPSLQVMPAAAHGSRVAAMIAFDLAGEDLAAGTRGGGARQDWEERYAGEEPMWSGNPNGTLVAEVADLPPGRALDVGAGEGGDAIWLAERGWQVTATDISEHALARVGAGAAQRGVSVELLRADANDPVPYPEGAYDLVSLQYGSFPRTPDDRGLRHVLAAVAPGGTLLVVAHDLAPMREPIDVDTQTRMWDPEAFVGVAEFAAALADDPAWRIDVHGTRPRPPGAASSHHVDDVVLRAVRLT